MEQARNRLLHPSVTRGLRDPEIEAAEQRIAKKTWGERIDNITQTALHDFVDIMAFLVMGAILAAGGKILRCCTPTCPSKFRTRRKWRS